MSTPCLYLCSGKDCRQRIRRHAELCAFAKDLPVEVVFVKCQKICKGPVVGWNFEDRIEWFKRMRGKKALRSLAALVRKGALNARLEKRRAKTRSGKLRD